MAEGARLKDAFVTGDHAGLFTKGRSRFYTGEIRTFRVRRAAESFYHNIDNDWHGLADQQGGRSPRRLCSSAASMTSAPSGAREGHRERAHEVMLEPRHPRDRRRRTLDQQEAPEETNRYLLDFLGGLRP